MPGSIFKFQNQSFRRKIFTDVRKLDFEYLRILSFLSSRTIQVCTCASTYVHTYERVIRTSYRIRNNFGFVRFSRCRPRIKTWPSFALTFLPFRRKDARKVKAKSSLDLFSRRNLSEASKSRMDRSPTAVTRAGTINRHVWCLRLCLVALSHTRLASISVRGNVDATCP